MDVILATAKKLQQERSLLEHKLNELRNERRFLEEKRQQAHAKLAHAKDTSNKMKETVKVAQLKVAQTQCQADSIESQNAQEKAKLDQLKNDREDLKKNQEQSIREFEEKLYHLTDLLMNANTYFMSGNVKNEIAGTGYRKQELSERVSSHVEAASMLQSEVAHKMSQSDTPALEVEHILQTHVINCLMEERGSLESGLQSVQMKLQQSQSQIEQLKQWQPPEIA